MNKTYKFHIEGMTCASCVSRVERAIKKIDGVGDVVVNLSTETASFTSSVISEASVALVRTTIEKSGFDVSAVDLPRVSIATRQTIEAKRWFARFATGVPISLIVMAIQMKWVDVGNFKTPALLLISLVFPFLAFPFLKGAFIAARGGGANMDTLVTLGAASALTFSIVTAGTAGESYFDAAFMIVTLISLGKAFEARSKARAAEVFEKMMVESTGVASVFDDGQWIERDVRKIEIGNRIRVVAGGVIPVDGFVFAGASSVDESLVTGESVPVKKANKDRVFSGSTVVDGTLDFEATAVGSQTLAARIQTSVENAQESKSLVQDVLTDKASAVFVPIVIIIALVTWFAWYFSGSTIGAAFGPAVAVLVVACPCALGLAVPVAMMIGSARAGERGILIRDIRAFERANKLTTIALDKTGTLTERRLKVERVDLVSGDLAHVLKIASALELHTTHPIAEAIVDYTKTKGFEIPEAYDVTTEAGGGIEGKVGGRIYRIGTSEYTKTEKVTANSSVAILTDEKNKRLVTFYLIGRLRADALEAIQELQRRDVDIWILSGDQKGAVTEIAKALSIPNTHVRAELKPHEKLEFIKELKKSGVVAMVGDGINDAPALAEADLSIALGSGADFAKTAADFTLISDSLSRVVDTIDLSHTTYRTIIQNLIWAFGYNVVLIPAAAFGYLEPIYASAAMALSSVSVILNSLRIRLKN